MARHLLKHIILGIAVALVVVFFFAYAIQSVYPAPEYEDFCGEYIDRPTIDSEATCIAVDGKWNPQVTGKVSERVELPPTSEGYCDQDFECRPEFDAASDVYERNVFFANVIIGIIVIIVSFLFVVEAISSGLLGGGVIMIVYGTIRYWGSLTDWLRTVMLGIALIFLIWIGYKKLR